MAKAPASRGEEVSERDVEVAPPKALDCGSLLPLSRASLLAVSRTDAPPSFNANRPIHAKGTRLSGARKTIRQQAGCEKRQLAAALQGLRRSVRHHHQIARRSSAMGACVAASSTESKYLALTPLPPL